MWMNWSFDMCSCCYGLYIDWFESVYSVFELLMFWRLLTLHSQYAIVYSSLRVRFLRVDFFLTVKSRVHMCFGNLESINKTTLKRCQLAVLHNDIRRLAITGSYKLYVFIFMHRIVKCGVLFLAYDLFTGTPTLHLTHIRWMNEWMKTVRILQSTTAIKFHVLDLGSFLYFTVNINIGTDITLVQRIVTRIMW